MRALVALLLFSSVAQAEPITLRLATVAPEGTAWARELHAFRRDVEKETDGRVQLKWVLGGIAGYETEILERIRRGQIDGLAASHLCERLAPSLRVIRTFGVLRSRAEERYIVQRLRDDIDSEFDKEGFVELGVLSLGMSLLFSREPVRSMEQLLARRWWIASDDDYAAVVARKLGLTVVPLPQGEALTAWDDHKIDGFVAIPASILAFQWAGVLRAYTDLPLASVDGCLLISKRSFERLRGDDQTAVRGAAIKALNRLDDISDETQHRVLAELGPRLGIQRVEPSAEFRTQFYEAVKQARALQIAPELLTRVLSMLADYRAEHR
jgi:TRAP-type C4-dicarboxylate transport system substrate-binding protein